MGGVLPFLIRHQFKILAGAAVLAALILGWPHLVRLYGFMTDREGMKAFIESRGTAAPLAFVGFQILQVMFAPVPGELSGFLGGYIFGTTVGFVYSSIGLAVGSAVNFWAGRALGRRFVRRVIPAKTLARLDAFVARQGFFVLLGCFIFPGFPKDYLCLLLGVTALPFKIFILLAGFGRMPGTLMLSLQGDFLFEENYALLAVMAVVSLVALGLAVRYRRALYGWMYPNDEK